MGLAAHSLHLRDRDPDRLPGRGGSHPLHVGSMACSVPTHLRERRVGPCPSSQPGWWHVRVSAPRGGMPTRQEGIPAGRPGPSSADVGAWLLHSPGSPVHWRVTPGLGIARGPAVALVCASTPGSASCCLVQVFPYVLHVCQPGMCGADAAANTQLAAPLPLLPLVSWAGMGRDWVGCPATMAPP